MFRSEDFTLFARAVALDSSSDATREVSIQPTQVSLAIKYLESTLTIRLFVCFMRNLRLTPEGEVRLPYARQMLGVTHAGLQKIQTPEGEVSGTLQITVSSDPDRNLLLPVLQSFRRYYPVLRLRIFPSSRVTDAFKGPVDVALRYNNTEDASYIALPVAPGNRHVLVASPGWVEQNGAPQKLNDLAQLNAMIFVSRGRLHDHWTFTRNGEVSGVQASGTIMGDGTEVIRRLAIAEEGVAYKPQLDVNENVRGDRLQLLMPDYQGEKVPLNMIYPHQKQPSTAAHLLHEVMRTWYEMSA